MRVKTATPAGSGKPQEPRKRRVRFHYIKSSHFRVIHVDGAWGGPTPHLNIQMSVFNERQPIPQAVTYAVKESGVIGDELVSERLSKDGFVREIEADLVFDLSTAESLVTWLQDKIEKLKARMAEAEKIQKEMEGKQE